MEINSKAIPCVTASLLLTMQKPLVTHPSMGLGNCTSWLILPKSPEIFKRKNKPFPSRMNSVYHIKERGKRCSEEIKSLQWGLSSEHYTTLKRQIWQSRLPNALAVNDGPRLSWLFKNQRLFATSGEHGQGWEIIQNMHVHSERSIICY